jgi:creatinine amidohydrolase
MDNKLPVEVQMQFMRPGQLEAAGRKFPVVYVPFGLIEWHGKHLPLGNDAIKAHAILVKAAEKYGGVVYPPVYFHSEFKQEHLVPVLTNLFKQLKKAGFRVIIGVSGHNIVEQIDMLNNALEPVIAEGGLAGTGLWEMTLSKCADSDTDHAAKWETSNMMFFYPELVDMAELGDEAIVIESIDKWGVHGLDPREHASAKVGELNCTLCAEAIGQKAHELLASLPEDQRDFNIEAIIPEHWWLV